MRHSLPTALIILDGFGYNPNSHTNAIAQAYKPYLDAWIQEYPHAYVHAAGEYVGLLPGLMGNSEVGHLTIGAGQIIQQPVATMHNALLDDSFFKNRVLHDNLSKLRAASGNVHIFGLLSNAGVHAYQEQLYAFIKAAVDKKIPTIYLHLFLDGRDMPPQSAGTLLAALEEYIKPMPSVQLGSLHGRFYAMDRDHNWDRIEQSYRVLTEPQQLKFTTWQQVLEHYYAHGITDEFIPPTQLLQESIVCNGDGIIFINFRPDRARELTEAFVDPDFKYFPTKKLKLTFFMTPVNYNHYTATDVLFAKELPQTTLMDDLAHKGLTTFSIAETEKYAHVTYFFRGGREEPLPTETQVLVPSIKTKTYIDYPCMSAPEITKAVVESLQKDPKDFYLINYANADMVGHSGNFAATVNAIECLDEQLGILYKEFVEQRNGTLYITADHGNAEELMPTGELHTEHTTNDVPFMVVRKDLKGSCTQLPLTQLADIRGFIEKDLN